METQESEQRGQKCQESTGEQDSGPCCGDTVQDVATMDHNTENIATSKQAAGDASPLSQHAPGLQLPDEHAEVEEQEAAVEAMETEEAGCEQGELAKNSQLLCDADNRSGNQQTENVDGEERTGTSHDSVDLVTVETADEDSGVSQGHLDTGLTVTDRNTEAEPRDRGKVKTDPDLVETVQEDSALVEDVIEVDSGDMSTSAEDDDMSTSAEDEDVLLAEENAQASMQEDSGDVHAAAQGPDESTAEEMQIEKDISDVSDDQLASTVETVEENEEGFPEKSDMNGDVTKASGNDPEDSCRGKSEKVAVNATGDGAETDSRTLDMTDVCGENAEKTDMTDAGDSAGAAENADVIAMDDSAGIPESNCDVSDSSPAENKERMDRNVTGDMTEAPQNNSIVNGESFVQAEKNMEEQNVSADAALDKTSEASSGKEMEDEPMLQITEVKSAADIENSSAEVDLAMPAKAEADSTKKDSDGQMADTALTSSEAHPQAVKDVTVDDDDDDVVVLDDDESDEVAPPKVKLESLGKEMFNNSSDMGIQIASVSGGADELHKMADQNQIKQENISEQRPPLTNPSLKTVAPPTTPPSGTSPARKTPSKSQTCIVCKRVGKCKYNIVRNGDIKHLCDDTCFKRFRTNPSMYLKGTANKPADSPASMPARGRPSKNAAPGTPRPQAPGKASPPAFKTCVVCQILNINNQSQFCMWKGMDFCGEGCLGKFQSSISTTCALCKSFIPLTARSTNCLRLGNQVLPFCSSRCYSDYKHRIRLCTFCHKELAKAPDAFSAPVGADSTFKDFCSQSCMKQFEGLMSTDVEIINVEQGKDKSANKCSVCQKVDNTKHAIKYSGVIHSLCSDPCLLAFRYANKLDMNTCDFCNTICSSLESTPHTVVFEGNKKRFCSDACVSKYRVRHRKMVPCSWCGSQRDNFDMIERLDSNSKYQLFCSLNCLSLFRVNLQAKSNQAVTCDHCHKFTPAQYHLTMSDASVRNFCSYNCVMSFQSQFSKGAPSLSPASSVLSQSAHKHNTRGKASNRSILQSASPGASSVPIISNVISLAPQGSQTVNIKNSTGAPVVVSGTSPGGKTPTTASPSINAPVQQKIIIQPPAPKVVKNKSLLCKPLTQTKATSCRPHAQSKECQTDEVQQKPSVVPVPVPVYLPAPMALYSAPAPTPVFIPIPIPVPVFIPTTRKSADGIMKRIKEVLEQTPSDPLEAELLQMAAAVSGEGNTVSDSDTEDEALPDTNRPKKRPLPVDDEGDAEVMPLASEKEDGEEDMISMALRMAEEITDLESAVEAVPVNSEPSTVAESGRALSEDAPQEDFRIRRPTRRNSRGAGRPKRPRLQEPAQMTTQAMIHQEPAAPPPDLNCHLKFSYGVNAWRHWVMFKNAQKEQNKNPGGGRVKLFKTDILQCTADELNYSLCLFVKEVRKPSGDEYSPDSIYYLTLGLQQYLYENGRIDNIFADHYYEPFTKRLSEILSLCQPKFNSAGQMVCRIEEEHLWECKQLGAHSPYVLLNTLIYFHTKYFMLKTPEDHLKLSFAHILKYWKKGPQSMKVGQGPRSVSLRYYSVSTARKDASATVSTTKRGSRDGIPVYEVVENANNPLRCPVKLYEFFLSKCPESIKNRSDIFYPVPERSCVPDSPVWYATTPISEEVMTRMLTRILLVREIQEAHLHARPIYV